MTEPALQPNMRVSRLDDVLETDIDNETVMMDIDQGRYFGLNRSATRIWEVLAEPVVIEDLVELLAAEFDVSREQCERDVMTFLEGLRARGLLSINP